MGKKREDWKHLESKIREQNLIHELVLINELLLREQEKLKKRLKCIPKLKQKIVELEKEKHQWTEQTRIEHSQKEATLQNRNIGMLAYYKDAFHKDENSKSEIRMEKPFAPAKSH